MNLLTNSTLSRRAMLRGLGTTLALPWLEAMGPLSSWAAATPSQRTAPTRMAFVYVPNGKDMAFWTPKKEGTDYEMPELLKPLSPFRQDINVFTDLASDKARHHGDGAGDHARALSSFLTGVHPKKTDGTDILCGTSVDQIAAQRIGDQTRLASLEIGCEQGNMAGNCDSGYSCVYSNTMSWRSPTQPLPKEVNPRLVFERLFGNSDLAARDRRMALRKSVLDSVQQDSKSLSTSLGKNDQRKLDEYFSSIRDIELQMERISKLPPLTPPANFPHPQGIPDNYQEHIHIMADLLALAFQADATRVATFIMANEGSNKAYPWIGVNEGHHELSHHGKDPRKLAKIREINKFHVENFAYLLGKLKSIREGEGTLLDNCMIAYGSGNSDGDRHSHDDLPILLAGRGGGTIQGGRHIRLGKETPVSNLWVSLLERMDVRVPVGDSTGALPILAT